MKYLSRLRVHPGDKVRLKDIDPGFTGHHESRKKALQPPHAPWFIIPSNHKWFRDLAIARIVVETLEALKLKVPKPSVDLGRIRREYHAARAK